MALAQNRVPNRVGLRTVDIYIDGEDKPPARVMIDPWNVQDEANWSIE